MAFGFGFNKAKTLAAAEKQVMAGKLTNAIAEYEKVAKNEPGDLNVLNTLGDLHARVGDGEQAASYFKRVADAYAKDGFTVKAIAMYKKLLKVSPSSLDVLHKLADLLVQQGLYSDARAQYVQVAEQFVKAGDLSSASETFQKILDLDPENASMQSKLADLFVKLGKKTEARDLFFRNAELFRSRGDLKAADEALGRVLGLDADYRQAILLRGSLKFDLGDAEGAIACLDRIPDIDSRPEALRTLLKAQLKLKRLDEAGPLARKLLTIFNDPTGVQRVAEAQAHGGDHVQAIALIGEFADRLLAADSAAIVSILETCISPAKNDPAMLTTLAGLLDRAGAASHSAEIKELLAHACVQSGDMARARDLYGELAVLEPQNPLHAQNYRQVLTALGETSTPAASPAQAGLPAQLEELEASAPPVPVDYPPEVAATVRGALTEAELYESYNLASKAVLPLEKVLGKHPLDPQINARLAVLYARLGRDAAVAARCRVLAQAYADAGLTAPSQQYADLAARFETGAPAEHPSEPATTASATPDVFNLDANLDAFAAAASPQKPASEVAPFAASSVAEFNFEDFASENTAFDLVDEPASQPATAAPIPSTPQPLPTEPVFETGEALIEAVPELVDEAPHAGGAEAGVFDLDIFDDAEGDAEPSPAPAVTPVPVAPSVPAQPAKDTFSSEWEDLLTVEDSPEASAGGAEHESGGTWQVVDETEDDGALSAAGDIAEEARFYLDQEMWDEARAAIARLEKPSPALAAELSAELAKHQGTPAAEPDLPTPDDLDWLSEPAAPAVEPLLEAPVATASAATRSATDDALDAFVLDLENELGDDFVITPATTAKEPVSAPAVAAVAAAPPVVTPAPAPVAIASPMPAAVAVAVATPEAATHAVEQPVIQAVAATDEVIEGALADIFAEFKSDMEGPAAGADDPETHYNLGVAFKEMGLLDEAIGELQKVCQAIERGQGFPQVMQAYTWLADCFVQKGVPEAAVRWYERALTLPGVDSQTRTALHYELACACELAGQKSTALTHFLEVYGANIDYRDVAERIQALRS